MSVEVRLLPNARRDRDSTLRWLEEREYFSDIQPYLDDAEFVDVFAVLHHSADPLVRS